MLLGFDLDSLLQERQDGRQSLIAARVHQEQRLTGLDFLADFLDA